MFQYEPSIYTTKIQALRHSTYVFDATTRETRIAVNAAVRL